MVAVGAQKSKGMAVMLAYLIVGVFAGIVGFAVALEQGASLWFAALVYSLVGMVFTVLPRVALLAVGKLGPSHLREEVLARDLDNAHPRTLGASANRLVASADPTEHGIRILAVDDDVYIRELLPKIAAKVGCPNVVLASSGMQAMELIEKSDTPFDCLLLDINMPEMSGIDLCAHVRSMAVYQHTPIIMLTAMTDMDHLERAYLAGASDYVSKPFDIIEFGERLNAAKVPVGARRTGLALEDRDAGVVLVRDRAKDWGIVQLAPRAKVAALIEYEALRNYLNRLSGGRLTKAYVMAVVLDRTSGNATDMEVMGLLTSVAVAIHDVLGVSGYLMSYSAPGEFVLVANGASLPDTNKLEVAIREQVNRASPDTDNAVEKLAMITVGAAVRPGRSNEDRARTAFELAITLANDRAAGKKSSLRFARVRPFGR